MTLALRHLSKSTSSLCQILPNLKVTAFRGTTRAFQPHFSSCHKFDTVFLSTSVARPAAPGKKAGAAGKGGGKAKKVLDVETDPHKLVNFVCGSNYKIDGEDVKIKPDSEYPDWLFTMDVRRPKPMSYEMENKDTIEYWLKVREEQMIKHRKLMKLKLFGLSNRK